MYNRKCKNCCNQNNNADINIINVDNDYFVSNNDINDNNSNSCDCGFDMQESVFPKNPVLAQSYVPIQKLDKTFIPSVGLKMGTIFPELVSPYKPCQSIEEIAFIKAMNTVKEGCNKC